MTVSEAGIEPLAPQAKEGLALVNGTTMMTGAAALAVIDAGYLLRLTAGAVALAAEALQSSSQWAGASPAVCRIR